MKINDSLANKIIWGVLILVMGALFFAGSFFLLSPYTSGDQEFYRSFYSILEGAGLSEIPALQYMTTGSAEPLYGIVMWFGANMGLHKDFYVSFFNVILCVSVALFLKEHRSGLVFSLLMFTNYYLVVILTSAERLKFAYIILLFSAIARREWLKRLFALIASFFHVQSLILLSSKILGRISSVKIERRVTKKQLSVVLFSLICIVVFFVVFFNAFSSYVLEKIAAYSSRGGLAGAANIIMLLIAAVFVFPKRHDIIISLSVCAIFSVIVGPERVNMIAVSLLVYFAVMHNKTNNPIILSLMTYFSLKSIDFIAKIYLFGDGFHQGEVW